MHIVLACLLVYWASYRDEFRLTMNLLGTIPVTNDTTTATAMHTRHPVVLNRVYDSP